MSAQDAKIAGYIARRFGKPRTSVEDYLARERSLEGGALLHAAAAYLRGWDECDAALKSAIEGRKGRPLPSR